MAPLLDRLASFILYGSKNDTPSKHMVVKHSADSALQVAQIEGLELKLSAALENFQAVLTVSTLNAKYYSLTRAF